MRGRRACGLTRLERERRARDRNGDEKGGEPLHQQ
jgi:hypothetical protein